MVKREADHALNEAMPILQEAQEAVSKLDNKAIDELKGFKKAVPSVEFTLKLVYMIIEKTTKIAKVSWDPQLKGMISVGFGEKLKKCNEEKDNIPKNIMDAIESQINSGEFTQDQVKSGS